jgi:hypothetical protein
MADSQARLLRPDEERDYFLRRAQEEERAAVLATTLKARWVHEELATLYRARAHALASETKHSAFIPPKDAAA